MVADLALVLGFLVLAVPHVSCQATPVASTKPVLEEEPGLRESILEDGSPEDGSPIPSKPTPTTKARFGEIKALSKFAKAFMRASGCDLVAEAKRGWEVHAEGSPCRIVRERVLAKTEKLSMKAKKEAAKLSATYYVKAMSTVLMKGAAWLATEYARVVGMLANAKMSEKNKEAFRRKRNILAVFSRQLPQELPQTLQPQPSHTNTDAAQAQADSGQGEL